MLVLFKSAVFVFLALYPYNNTRICAASIYCEIYCSLYSSRFAGHLPFLSVCKVLEYHCFFNVTAKYYCSSSYYSFPPISPQYPNIALSSLISVSISENTFRSPRPPFPLSELAFLKPPFSAQPRRIPAHGKQGRSIM